MQFTDIFIRRPVLATVVSLMILLVGLRSFMALEVRQFPKMEFSVIGIYTSYPGADAALIQGFVTSPLQQAVAEAEGIDYMSSTSRQGLSTIQAFTVINKDAGSVLTEIQAKVAGVRYLLPQEVKDPVISSTTVHEALMYIAFTSDSMSVPQLTDYLIREVQPKLQTLPGVGEAKMIGRNFAQRIWIDPARLAAIDLTASELVDKLRTNNFLAGIGSLRDDEVQITLATNTAVNNPADFEKLIIKDKDGVIVRLGDIARTELGSQSYDIVAWHAGRRSVYIGIELAPGANPLAVARLVKGLLPEIRQQLPADVKLALPLDNSEFIEDSIAEVNSTILETLLIVLAVIYLTLGTFRAALIPAVTVPLSLIGGAFIMLLLGFSLNLLTLLSMVLAIGLVVDDAIIVVENVHRHIQEGKPRLEAALQGAREIAMPVIAMTITLIAVYIPIGFMGGLVGSLFTEFAFTLAGAVLVSGIIALTLSPMMASRILKPAESHARLEEWIDRGFDRAHVVYRRILESALRVVWLPIYAAAILLVSIFFMFQFSDNELAPTEDIGMLGVMAVGPQTATLNYLEGYARQMQAIYESLPEYQDAFMIFGMNTQNSFISTFKSKPRDRRDRSLLEIKSDLQQRFQEVTGVRLAVFSPPAIPGAGSGLPVQFVITSSRSFTELDQVADTLLEQAMASGRFSFLQKSVAFDRPLTRVVFDKDRVSDLGLSMADVGRAMTSMLGDHNVNRFEMQGRSYDVMPIADWDARRVQEDIEKFYLRTDSGDLVPASSILSFQHEVEPSTRTQHNQFNAITLEGSLAWGTTMGEALEQLETIAAETFPKDFAYDYKGQARQYKQQGNTLVITFFLSLLVIYLVLAALFESWRDPLIILVTVPLAVVGAMSFIMLGATTMNIYTQVGLITLIGVVSKNGILIVDFANKLQVERHLDKKAAVIEAAVIRLRPIFMTSAAMILAMTPLLLSTGAGAESRFAIGLTIATGLSIGTVLTLLVLPAFYILLARRHNDNASQG